MQSYEKITVWLVLLYVSLRLTCHTVGSREWQSQSPAWTKRENKLHGLRHYPGEVCLLRIVNVYHDVWFQFQEWKTGWKCFKLNKNVDTVRGHVSRPQFVSVGRASCGFIFSSSSVYCPPDRLVTFLKTVWEFPGNLPLHRNYGWAIYATKESIFIHRRSICAPCSYAHMKKIPSFRTSGAPCVHRYYSKRQSYRVGEIPWQSFFFK